VKNTSKIVFPLLFPPTSCLPSKRKELRFSNYSNKRPKPNSIPYLFKSPRFHATIEESLILQSKEKRKMWKPYVASSLLGFVVGMTVGLMLKRNAFPFPFHLYWEGLIGGMLH